MTSLDYLILGVLASVILGSFVTPALRYQRLARRFQRQFPLWVRQWGLRLWTEPTTAVFEQDYLPTRPLWPPLTDFPLRLAQARSGWVVAGEYHGVRLQFRPVEDHRWETRRTQRRPVIHLTLELRIFQSGLPHRPSLSPTFSHPDLSPLIERSDGFQFSYPIGVFHPKSSGRLRILAFFQHRQRFEAALDRAVALTKGQVPW